MLSFKGGDMIAKDLFEDILSKYPELIDPGLTFRSKGMELYGYMVDMLFMDRSGRKLVVTVRTAPIAEEHIGELISHKNAVLSGENPALNVMMVSDKIPSHLQKSLEHEGVSWKEITVARIREHLDKAGDTEMLKAISG